MKFIDRWAARLMRRFLFWYADRLEGRGQTAAAEMFRRQGDELVQRWK